MPELRLATKRTLIALAVLICLAPLVFGFVIVASDFGPRAASVLFFLFLLPSLVVAVRLHRRWPAVQGREVVYLAVLSCVALGAVVFVVRDWYDKGLQYYHAEDVRWSEFGRLMRRDPAFRNVQIRLTHRKHIYYVEGSVASQADLDRLQSLAIDCGIDRKRLDGPYIHSVSIQVWGGRADRDR